MSELANIASLLAIGFYIAGFVAVLDVESRHVSHGMWPVWFFLPSTSTQTARRCFFDKNVILTA